MDNIRSPAWWLMDHSFLSNHDHFLPCMCLDMNFGLRSMSRHCIPHIYRSLDVIDDDIKCESGHVLPPNHIWDAGHLAQCFPLSGCFSVGSSVVVISPRICNLCDWSFCIRIRLVSDNFLTPLTIVCRPCHTMHHLPPETAVSIFDNRSPCVISPVESSSSTHV